MQSGLEHSWGFKTSDANNLLPRPIGQKRSVLSQAWPSPESLKNPVPETLGKTVFDFVTFLAALDTRSLVQAGVSGRIGLKTDLDLPTGEAAFGAEI